MFFLTLTLFFSGWSSSVLWMFSEYHCTSLHYKKEKNLAVLIFIGYYAMVYWPGPLGVKLLHVAPKLKWVGHPCSKQKSAQRGQRFVKFNFATSTTNRCKLHCVWLAAKILVILKWSLGKTETTIFARLDTTSYQIKV